MKNLYFIELKLAEFLFVFYLYLSIAKKYKNMIFYRLSVPDIYIIKYWYQIYTGR
jgi:hypothetical protein